MLPLLFPHFVLKLGKQLEGSKQLLLLLLLCRDGHVRLFSFCLFIIRERPISFFLIVQKIINFVLKVCVHFPFISFVFSLNDRLVKSFVHYNRSFSKNNDNFFKNLFQENCLLEKKNNSYFLKIRFSVRTFAFSSSFERFRSLKKNHFFISLKDPFCSSIVRFFSFLNDTLQHKKFDSLKKKTMSISTVLQL